MQKELSSLKATAVAGLIADRLKAVSAAAPEVRDPESYPANRLASALHPHVQHLKVREVIVHSPDLKTFVLEADAARGTKTLAWFSAGQYLALAVPVDGRVHLRPYSISSSPRQTKDGVYCVTVKRVEGGIVSNFILDNWEAGTRVVASGPLGDFTYEPLRDAKTVIGIAGGSGITPFYAFARAIAEGDEDFDLILLYGSRTKADAVFAPEIVEIAKTTPRVKLVQVLSDEKKKGCASGFITAKLIRKYAPEGEDYSVFLCGPQAMYRFVDKELEKLGLRKKFIRHEVFGEYFHPEEDEAYPKEAPKGPFTVKVRQCGKEYTISCAAGTSLLRAMEAAGIVAPSDCRSGKCGYCHSRLVSGDVYVPEAVDGRRMGDKDYGYIHPCITFPLSDVEIEVPGLPM